MLALFALLMLLGVPADSSPPPATLDLPEIGRVRAISPACGVLRDLAGPSFLAAREGDKSFEDVSKTLPDYVKAIADDSKYNPEPPVLREMRLSRLGVDKTKMLRNAKTIADALGDPRLAVNSKDPAVQSEREQLQSLYDVQITRASELNQYVMREENATALLAIGKSGAFARRGGDRAQETPEPRVTTTPLGMPILHGVNGMADAASIRDWTGQITAAVKSNEYAVAKSLTVIQKSCQGK